MQFILECQLQNLLHAIDAVLSLQILTCWYKIIRYMPGLCKRIKYFFFIPTCAGNYWAAAACRHYKRRQKQDWIFVLYAICRWATYPLYGDVCNESCIFAVGYVSATCLSSISVWSVFRILLFAALYWKSLFFKSIKHGALCSILMFRFRCNLKILPLILLLVLSHSYCGMRRKERKDEINSFKVILLVSTVTTICTISSIHYYTH